VGEVLRRKGSIGREISVQCRASRRSNSRQACHHLFRPSAITDVGQCERCNL